MNYIPILQDPSEFNETEADKCKICYNDLVQEETQEEMIYCFECFYSCCGDELDQDIRICPTCKEHN